MLSSPSARVAAAYDEALRDAEAHRMSHSPHGHHHHHHHRRHHSSPRRRYHGRHSGHKHHHHHRPQQMAYTADMVPYYQEQQAMSGGMSGGGFYGDHHHHHGATTGCIPREYGNEQDYLEHAHRLTAPEELPEPDPRDLPPNMMGNYRQRISKMLVIPHSRQVKVPVVTQKEVETTELRPTRSKHLVTNTNFEVHEEEYTQLIEKTETRWREMYIRTVVPEEYTYTEAVPLKRQIVRPVQETREFEVEEMLPQRVSKIVDVPGYRVDEIQENKLVEVDGWQEFKPVVQYVPAGFGYDHAHLAGEEGHGARYSGNQLYDPDHVSHVPLDPSSPNHYYGRTSPSATVQPVSPRHHHHDVPHRSTWTNDIYYH